MRVYTTGSLPQHILSGNMSHFGGTAHQRAPLAPPLLTVVNSALFVLLTTIYEASILFIILFYFFLFFFILPFCNYNTSVEIKKELHIH